MKKNEVHVLIVDDDESTRKALGEAVQRAGFKSVVAAKADEALSMVKIKPIHAALVDCMLPVRNGVDLAIEFRRAGLEKAPVFLLSGIYRDRAFAAEAVRKTGAAEFLYKPLDLAKIVETLNAVLAPLIDAPKVAIHSLMSMPFASQRERRKALDHVEEATGFDLPFILCILMDAESSGYLNIVNSSDEIYGINMHKGRIIKVDSGQSVATLTMQLIDKGFLSPQEIEEYQRLNKKGDFLDGLIEENLVSPHAEPIIKKEQMLGELRRLMTDEVVRVNFVPDRKMKDETIAIERAEFSDVVHDFLEVHVTQEWLRKFYEPWLLHPIRPAPGVSESDRALSYPVVTRVSGLKTDIRGEATLQDLLSRRPGAEFEVLKAVHFLCLHRLVVFDEQKKSFDFAKDEERLKALYKELKNKDAFEIFAFFGAHPDGRAAEVTRIYRDFAKANHPDTLPAEAPESLKKLNHELFALITSAQEVLTDDVRRERYITERKQKDAERQLKAENMIEEGISLLRKGRAIEALQLLDEGVRRAPTDVGQLHLIWARIKANKDSVDEATAVELDGRLNDLAPEQRRTPLFHLVQGMLRRAKGDRPGAFQSFGKALQLDPRFLDARREIQSLRSGVSTASSKITAQELFTGDLGQIAKNLFKLKKSK